VLDTRNALRRWLSLVQKSKKEDFKGMRELLEVNLILRSSIAFNIVLVWNYKWHEEK